MRKLGEQWIEKDYGGKPHMYKAVGVNDKFDPCIGCCNQGNEEECYNAHSNCGRGVVIIKDLGPVNEDWYLADERTLRDWFAGLALNGMLPSDNEPLEIIARDAYRYADAMLKERNK